jgi:hypothetical protein
MASTHPCSELLHEGVLRLTGHDIFLRIDAEAVQMEELAGLAPWPADVVSRVWNDLTLETFEIRPKLRGRPLLQRIAATDQATYKRGEARRYNVREGADFEGAHTIVSLAPHR